MQSAFPTSPFPGSAETAAPIAPPTSSERPSGTVRRHEDGEATTDSAFSDMVAASRTQEEAVGAMSANRTKSSGETTTKPGADVPASGNTPAEPAGKPDTSAKDMSSGAQDGGKASPAAPATEAGTSATTAPVTGSAGSGQAATAGTAAASTGATPVVATTPAPDSAPSGQAQASAAGADVGAPVPKASQPASASVSAVTPATEPAAKASPVATGQDAPAAGTDPTDTAPSEQARPRQTAGKPAAAQPAAGEQVSNQPFRTATVTTTPGVVTAETGKTAASTAQTAAALPGAGEPVQAKAGESVQTAPAAGQQATPTAAGTAGAGTTAGTPSASTRPATTAASEIQPDPLRETEQARAILEPGQDAKSSTKAGSRKPATGQVQQSSLAGNQTATSTAMPAAEVKADPVTALPRETAPSTPSPLMQVLSQQTAGTAMETVSHQPAPELDAAQSDFDLQLNRTGEARTGLDRSGANLPRFAPHTAQQLAGQITRQFNNGQRVFDIRLDPAELGKVDVRLELRADNRVHAVLMAERPETLSELQRAARDLERSLNDAGLELAEDGLTFQMSDDGNATGSGGNGRGDTLPVFAESGDTAWSADTTTAPAAQQTRYGFLLARREGVDVRV